MIKQQRFRIHPLLICIFVSIFFYGDMALYAMLFSSLLIHEAGHLLVAYFCRVSIQSVVLLPYGAEITFMAGEKIIPKHLLWIAFGGPIATASLAIICVFLPELYKETLLQIQFTLFFFNMLPIWSLDGGRVVYALILLFYPSSRLYEYYVTLSFIMSSTLVIIVILYFTKFISLIILSSFLWLQVWQEWKYRKYRAAFEKHVLQRLT